MKYQCGGFEVTLVELGGIPKSCYAIFVDRQIAEEECVYNEGGLVHLDETSNMVYTVYKSLVHPYDGVHVYSRYRCCNKLLQEKADARKVSSVNIPIGSYVEYSCRVYEVTGYENNKLVCKAIRAANSDSNIRTLFAPTEIHIVERSYKAVLISKLQEAYREAEGRQYYNQGCKASGHMRGLQEAINIARSLTEVI